MSFPVPRVYGHISQIENYRETDDAQIRQTMTAFAAECKAKKIERTYLFDFSRDCSAQKVRVNPIVSEILVGLHRHDYYEINYVLNGSLYEFTNGSIIRLEKNGFALFPPTVFHSIYPFPGSTCFNILIDKSYFEALREKICVNFNSPVLDGACDRQRAVFMNVSEKSEVHFAAAELYRRHVHLPDCDAADSLPFELIHCRFSLFFLSLLSMEQNGKLSTDICPNASKRETADKTDRMIAYIRDNYQTITLQKLSREFGYSASQIHRLLVKYTGLRLSDLIDQSRFNHSLMLLRETNLPLEKISETVGLEKTSFCRFFKRVGFCTPLQYRKNGDAAINNAIAEKLAFDQGS